MEAQSSREAYLQILLSIALLEINKLRGVAPTSIFTVDKKRVKEFPQFYSLKAHPSFNVTEDTIELRP